MELSRREESKLDFLKIIDIYNTKKNKTLIKI